MKTKFSQRLEELLNSPKNPESSPETIKTAGAKDISVEGLRKIANILRTTSVEPSYEDLHAMYSRIKR